MNDPRPEEYPSAVTALSRRTWLAIAIVFGLPAGLAFFGLLYPTWPLGVVLLGALWSLSIWRETYTRHLFWMTSLGMLLLFLGLSLSSFAIIIPADSSLPQTPDILLARFFLLAVIQFISMLFLVWGSERISVIFQAILFGLTLWLVPPHGLTALSWSRLATLIYLASCISFGLWPRVMPTHRLPVMIGKTSVMLGLLAFAIAGDGIRSGMAQDWILSRRQNQTFPESPKTTPYIPDDELIRSEFISRHLAEGWHVVDCVPYCFHSLALCLSRREPAESILVFIGMPFSQWKRSTDERILHLEGEAKLVKSMGKSLAVAMIDHDVQLVQSTGTYGSEFTLGSRFEVRSWVSDLSMDAECKYLCITDGGDIDIHSLPGGQRVGSIEVDDEYHDKDRYPLQITSDGSIVVGRVNSFVIEKVCVLGPLQISLWTLTGTGSVLLASWFRRHYQPDARPPRPRRLEEIVWRPDEDDWQNLDAQLKPANQAPPTT